MVQTPSASSRDAIMSAWTPICGVRSCRAVLAIVLLKPLRSASVQSRRTVAPTFCVELRIEAEFGVGEARK
jgi:hypothetical protein